MNTTGNKHQEGIQKKSKNVDTFVWRNRTLNSGAQFASTPTNLFAPALYMVPMQGQRGRMLVRLSTLGLNLQLFIRSTRALPLQMNGHALNRL
jgi:hypothetical protein